MSDVLEFSTSLIRLRDVHVHLIAVEVSIVRGADRQVEAEGVVGQNAYTVPHHTHTMESGLTVEQNVVSILQVALHYRSVVYHLRYLLRFVVDLHQVHYFLVLASILRRLDYVLDLAFQT